MFGFGKLKAASNRTWVLFLTTLFVLGVAQSTEGGISGSARRGVQSLNGLRGAVTLSAGTNITLTPVGLDIEIAATGGGTTNTVGDCVGADCFTAASPDAVLTFDNATSGTVTLQTVAGALGTVTVSLPAETGTIFTDAATIPVANGGTNLTASADDEVMVGNATTWESKALTDCNAADEAVTYDTATNAWGCNTIVAGSGDITAVGDCLTAACFTSGSPDAVITFDNATSGTVTLQTVTGALGAVTASLPAETGTIVTSATSLVGDVTGNTGATVVGNDSHAHTGTTLSSVDLTTDITGTLPVENGGTETTSLTDGGIMLGSGVTAVTVTAQPTDGQLLIGDTAADPVLATLTDGTGITITEGAGTITVASTLGTSVDLTSEVTGTLPVANGGTNLVASADDNLMVGNATTWQTKAVPDCDDSGGNHLNYDTGTNAFSCGTTAGTGSFNVDTFTRDTALATGTQAITGVGFTPIGCFFFVNEQAGAETSWGFDDGTTRGALYDHSGVTADTFANTDNAILVEQSSGLTYTATIQSFDGDGFTLAWVRSGAPTGTITIKFACLL